MTVGLAELHEAIVTNWNLAATLWSGEAPPGESFPYVVFQQGADVIAARMSGSGTNVSANQRIHDVPVEFRCHTQKSGALSAKEEAAALAEEVMKIYGGHPTNKPTALGMTSGQHVITQLISEFDVKTSDDVHMWTLVYNFKVDLPVKV